MSHLRKQLLDSQWQLSGLVMKTDGHRVDRICGNAAWAIMDARKALVAAEAKNARLREENAALWKRVKLWEPMADPSNMGSGSAVLRDTEESGT